MAEEPSNKPNRRSERIGKYEILDHIATGGMGTVYTARDVDLDRVVALKILPPEMANQEQTLLRFRREAKAAAKLRHVNIVAIFDVGESNGTYFLALEYIEGTDLQAYINRKKRLEPEEARQIMIQATRALIHAHENGVVHRDIKPSNFLLSFREDHLIVKLTDFGLAIRNENDEEYRLTRDGTTVGTVDYISPEQARNSQAADIRSDIYSLGCTFFHMLAGIAPFARGSLPERLIQHMQKPPPDVRRLNKVVPDGFVAIINRMMAKKPDERYQTPTELLHDLENPEKLTAPPPRPPAAASGRSKVRGPEPGKESVDPAAMVEIKDSLQESEITRRVKIARPKKDVVESSKDKTRAGAKPGKPPRKPRSPIPEMAVEEAEQDIEEEASDTEVDEGDSSQELLGLADEDAPRRGKAKKSTQEKLPWWVYVAGGSVGLLGLILVMAFAFADRSPRPKKDEPVKPNPQPIVVVPETKIEPPPVAIIDTSATKMSVRPPVLAVMEVSAAKADSAALDKEFRGPFTAFPAIPEAAPRLKLRRLATTEKDTYRTLADALAQTEPNAWTVIEIHDNGPISVASLAALSQRSVVLRAGAGYRPLLAWDVPRSFTKEKPSPTLFSLSQGKLLLENIDVVVSWPDEQLATVFDLQEADFYARGCTFSLTGKSTAGITLVRQRALKKDGGEGLLTQTWLQRCYVRGAEMTLLSALNTSTSVLLEESLVAGQTQPLFQFQGRDEDAFQWRCLRSTLIAGQNALRCQSIKATKGSPHLQAWVLDSILSRNDPTAPLGDLLHLASGVEASRMSWKVSNSVYAGWKKLLAADAGAIAGHGLESWHRQWNYSTGDRLVVEPWPSNPLSRLEEAPAQAFLPPFAGPVTYAALTGSGAIGCVIGRLPPDPTSWSERTFEAPKPPGISPTDIESPPVIATTADGLYHGEKIDLNKIEDLGAYVNNLLQQPKLAPRIILHLSGKGTHKTSSIRIKGVQHLVLYVEPAKDLKEALRLVVNIATLKKQTPLLEMLGGHLEVIGARIQLNSFTSVPVIFRVQEGNLTLKRCWLQGPLIRSPEAFQSIISVSSSPDMPATLFMRDNVLLSGKLLLHLQDQVRLQARNNVLVSLDDGMLCEASEPLAAMTHVIDHNTWAIRRTTFTLRMVPEFLPAASIVLHANSNAFLNPFTEEADKTLLLRGAEPAVSRGRWIWQGHYNVYDARLHAYFGALDQLPGDKQTLADWQKVWGTAGEHGAALFEAGPPRKTIPLNNVAADDLLLRLDRLALPRLLRGDPVQAAPPGADLVSLRILTKK